MYDKSNASTCPLPGYMSLSWAQWQPEQSCTSHGTHGHSGSQNSHARAPGTSEWRHRVHASHLQRHNRAVLMKLEFSLRTRLLATVMIIISSSTRRIMHVPAGRARFNVAGRLRKRRQINTRASSSYNQKPSDKIAFEKTAIEWLNSRRVMGHDTVHIGFLWERSMRAYL